MWVQDIVCLARVALRSDLEDLSNGGGFVKLHKQRFGIALRVAQSIRCQLDRGESPGDRVSDCARLRVGRRAAIDGHVRFELHRIEACGEAADDRAKRRAKRLARSQPQRKFCVCDLDFP